MNLFYIQAILTASLGGVLYGYDMGVISGALPLLSSYFQLTSSQEEWVVSLLYFGGGIGATMGGFICDWFGRKTAIMFTDIVFVLGAVLLYLADTVEAVMVGRFVVGYAVAVSGIADVVYLHEISSVWESVVNDGRESDANTSTNTDLTTISNEEKSHAGVGGRGSVVSVNEACISLGFLLAFGVAYSIGDEQSPDESGAKEASDAWRVMFGFGGCIATAQFLGMICMPETPVWLRGKGRIQEANAASNRIRGMAINSHNIGSDNISGILEMSSGTVSTAPPPSPSSSEHFAIDEQPHSANRNSRAVDCIVLLWINVRRIPSFLKQQYQRIKQEILIPYKRQSIIATLLAASQQFCGHPSVMSYSPEIFELLNNGNQAINNDSDGESMSPLELTVGIGLIKFITTCLVIVCIERRGRRCFLLSGMSCILISLLCLCIAFMGLHSGIENNSDNTQQQQHFSSFKSDIGIIGIYGVALGYAASFGPLTWLITSELFPSAIRGRALGFATIVTYMSAGLVSNTFISLQETVGLSACFAFYFIATLFTIVFAWLGLPDTSGEKTPEEINCAMNNMWLWSGRKQLSRCPLFVRWSQLSSYGSLGNNPSHDDVLDNISSLDKDNTAGSTVKRRPSSSHMKEII